MFLHRETVSRINCMHREIILYIYT